MVSHCAPASLLIVPAWYNQIMQTKKTGTGDVVFRPKHAPSPLDNPLKGWCPYADDGGIFQPYSQTFQYVSWRDLEPTPGNYRFADWEKVWDAPAARNKHVIFRVVLDYPTKPTGVPQWLLDAGVQMRPYTDYGGGLSPDYDDPRLLSALERFIAALGKRYNNHPRVAFVQLGLLGFWGEWHTYPRPKLFASPKTQQRVLEAAHRAFPQTLLMTRYPDGIAGKLSWVGYFDDMFPEDTDGPEDWQFLPKMKAAKRTENWKHAPIGGEMVPLAAPKLLGAGFKQTLARMEAAHFSWVGPYCPALEKSTNAEYIARSQQMVRRMGYEFSLSEVRHARSAKANRPLAVHVAGKNSGIAPFYYPWDLEIALLDKANVPQAIRRAPVDIRTWLPGAFAFSDTITLPAKPGSYTLALRIVNPYKSGPVLRLANALPQQGTWTRLSPVTVV